MLSKLYKSAIQLRHFFYDQGWIETHVFPACVVSVGNIVCGGTGKTPLVQKLARELTDKCKVAILSRGYKGKAEHFSQSLQISKGSGPLTTSDIAGDEPYLHALDLPGVAVWVGKSRISSAQMATQQNMQVLLLDDGMQHRKIKRDHEIVIIDGQDDLNAQAFLPFGRLRDMPERLKFATLIVVSHAPHDRKKILEQIKVYSSAPVIFTRMLPKKENADLLRYKKIAFFCGLGRPERFEQTLNTLEVDVVCKLITADHATFSKNKLEKFAEEAKEKGAEYLVCTRKDFIKLPMGSQFALPLRPLEAELDIIAGQAHWDAFIEKIIIDIQKQEKAS